MTSTAHCPGLTSCAIKKNHDDEHHVHLCGFKACNTLKKTKMTSYTFHLGLISHVKKTTMMNVTLIVMVSKLATQKNPKQQATFVIPVLKDEQ
jgi:hypothetical protein